MFRKVMYSLLSIALVAVLLWVFTTNWAIRDDMDVSVHGGWVNWFTTEEWTIATYNGYKCSAHNEKQYPDGSYIVSFRFDPAATKPPQ